jgi:CRISPR-associated endonuclease/helicase Cas3
MTDASSGDATAYAHSLPGETPERWERLEVHLQEVSELAGELSQAFGAREWGELAGWWHDLGTYKPEFQARLRGSRDQVEHAGIGAALAASHGAFGQALGLVVAGHHAGLANLLAQGETGLRSLIDRVRENTLHLDRLRSIIPTSLVDRPLPAPPAGLIPSAPGKSAHERARRRIDFWTRFLFSALVDADRLATEAFYEPGKRESIHGFDALPTLREKLDRHLDRFDVDTEANHIRAQVLAACRTAADREPGIFSLTFPTGGGKTLSSMAFALRHSEHHRLRRAIVVIPYTSIIEQNARVYRNVFGATLHGDHGNVDGIRLP